MVGRWPFVCGTFEVRLSLSLAQQASDEKNATGVGKKFFAVSVGVWLTVSIVLPARIVVPYFDDQLARLLIRNGCQPNDEPKKLSKGLESAKSTDNNHRPVCLFLFPSQT